MTTAPELDQRRTQAILSSAEFTQPPQNSEDHGARWRAILSSGEFTQAPQNSEDRGAEDRGARRRVQTQVLHVWSVGLMSRRKPARTAWGN